MLSYKYLTNGDPLSLLLVNSYVNTFSRRIQSTVSSEIEIPTYMDSDNTAKLEMLRHKQ